MTTIEEMFYRQRTSWGWENYFKFQNNVLTKYGAACSWRHSILARRK